MQRAEVTPTVAASSPFVWPPSRLAGNHESQGCTPTQPFAMPPRDSQGSTTPVPLAWRADRLSLRFVESDRRTTASHRGSEACTPTQPFAMPPRESQAFT